MIEDYQKVKEGIKSIQDDPLLEDYEKESAIKDLLEMEFTYEINPISMDALLTDSLGNEILIENDVDLLIIEEYLC